MAAERDLIVISGGSGSHIERIASDQVSGDKVAGDQVLGDKHVHVHQLSNLKPNPQLPQSHTTNNLPDHSSDPTALWGAASN